MWEVRPASGEPRRMAHLAAAFLLTTTAAWADESVLLSVASRSDEPVTVPGAMFPQLAGRSIAQLAVFRWNATANSFEPIPFQIDERIDHTFDEVPGYAFVQNIHDVFNEDDGLLDADDEIVFLFGDAGAEAPDDAPWVGGAEATRFDIEIADPRPDAPEPERHAYVFAGTSLPRSTDFYITWNGLATSSVLSSAWSIGFSDRWILDTLRVEPPCGSGGDLIDRLKGRAGQNLLNESEQDWNATSIFLGHVVGPVRAVRYVRGAASGLNTIHHDIFYRRYWERVFHLRVHPIPAVAVYFDLLPNAGTTVFTSNATSGLPVDGTPDFAGSTFVPWAVVRGPSGGYVTLYNAPASPFYFVKRFYYRDDQNYDDATGPLYLDEDHSSFGAQGVELRNLIGSESDAIYFSLRVYPLCANDGDAELGAAYQALADHPLALSVAAETAAAGPVRSLRVGRAGADIEMSWEAVIGATGYRIYTASTPNVPHAMWSPLADVTTTSFVDAGAANLPLPRFYSVVGLLPSGETEW